MKERTYIFFRSEDFFYFIQLRDDISAIENATLNKGTIRVENLCGDIIWQLNNN